MRAGKTFHATFAIGVFAAIISPARPTGSLIIDENLFETPLVVVFEYNLCPSLA